MIVTLSMAIGTLLAGCATDNIGTQDAGAALPRAQYQVLGLTKYDQAWIDKTIEGEVAGFHFARPAKRPASLSAPARVKVPPRTPVSPTNEDETDTKAPNIVTPPLTVRERIELLNEKVRKLEGKQ